VDAALVDAQAAVDPLEGESIDLGLLLQRCNPVLGERMGLFVGVAAMHRIAVGRLPGNSERHSALVGENAHIGAALQRCIEQPEEGDSTFTFEGRVHECECQSLVHVYTPQFQMTLWPASMASMT